MSFPKLEEIKDFELEKIEMEIIELKKQLFQLRIKKGTRQTFKPHFFKHIQHRLNQLTFLENKKIFDKTNF